MKVEIGKKMYNVWWVYDLRSFGITTCWIMQYSEKVVEGETISMEAVKAVGLSLCSNKDTFCKKVARKVSLDRALRGIKAPINVIGREDSFPDCFGKYDQTDLECVNICPHMHICFHSVSHKHIFTKTERSFFWATYAHMTHADWSFTTDIKNLMAGR